MPPPPAPEEPAPSPHPRGQEDFKRHDAASYDRVARPFDRFGDRFTAPLAELLVARARLAGASDVLDVGTGTGVVAFAAARALAPLAPGGRVLGIDLSEGMLATAAEKAGASGLAVDFRRMDAEALELEDASFDRVLSLFALTHLPDPERALAEMRRVLRPGGRLVVAVGSGPPATSLAGWAHRARRACDELLARAGRRLIAPGFLEALAERSLPERAAPSEADWSARHRNRSAVLPELVRAAGFAEVRAGWTGRVGILGSPEEFWDLQATISTPARKRLAEAPPEAVQALRSEHDRRCRAVLERGGRLLYPYAAAWVSATRPA